MIGQKGVLLEGRAGGIEKHVAEIGERLVNAGHTVFVYSRKRYMPKTPNIFRGMQIIYIPTLYLKNVETIIYTFFSTLHAIFQKFDVIHYHGVGPATLAWIPRLFARKATVIVTFHSRDRFHQKWGSIGKNYLALGERAAVLFPHYTIAVSHIIQVLCRDVYHREVVYIPNGAEVISTTDTGALKEFGLKASEYFLNVGRIVPQKGLHYLVDAFRQVKTDKQLVIVGAPSFTDDYFLDLKKRALRDPRVHLLGFQKGDTLDQLYAHAFLYVHPSLAEGLPLVVLEAMSHGTAPLVSDIPENMEAMHHGGFSFKSGSIKSLQEALQFAVNHPKDVLEKSEESQAIIETNFNWDVIARHTESVYITARH